MILDKAVTQAEALRVQAEIPKRADAVEIDLRDIRPAKLMKAKESADEDKSKNENGYVALAYGAPEYVGLGFTVIFMSIFISCHLQRCVFLYLCLCLSHICYVLGVLPISLRVSQSLSRPIRSLLRALISRTLRVPQSLS